MFTTTLIHAYCRCECRWAHNPWLAAVREAAIAYTVLQLCVHSAEKSLCVSGVIHARQRSSRGWIVDALTQDDGMLTTTSAEDCTALLGRSSSTAKEVVSRPEIPHSSYVRSM